MGLVYRSGIWISWFFSLKIVYIHLACAVDGSEASILKQ